MILHHFTCPRLLWGDDWKSHYDRERGCVELPARDLLPSNRQYDDERFPERFRVPVVWLTTSPETVPAKEPRGLRLLLTVHLPSTDRRLVRYGKWLGASAPVLAPDLDKRVRAQWWVYRGVIPDSRIVAGEMIVGRRPWWEVVTPNDLAA